MRSSRSLECNLSVMGSFFFFSQAPKFIGSTNQHLQLRTETGSSCCLPRPPTPDCSGFNTSALAERVFWGEEVLLRVSSSATGPFNTFRSVELMRVKLDQSISQVINVHPITFRLVVCSRVHPPSPSEYSNGSVPRWLRRVTSVAHLEERRNDSAAASRCDRVQISVPPPTGSGTG